MRQRIKIYVMPIILMSLLVLFGGLSLSQEAQEPSRETSEEQNTELQTNWIWGEVVSVDVNSGQLLLRCVDYDTETEKNMTIYTSTKTNYENVSGLAGIKPEDTVSIDYIMTDNDRMLAELVSKEDLEALPDESSPPLLKSDMPDKGN